MSTKVEKRILVNVPVSTAYNQWTQFEEFPHFMGGVKSVTQLSDDRLAWVAEIGGVRRQWEAKILEQVPDRKVAWAATEGATNAGAVEFEDVGGGQTSIQLTLEYEPEGLIEKVGDKLNVVDRQAEADLKRFKEFIEDEGYASGAWRGSVSSGAPVGTPGVEDAAGSRGDSGKAGVSGKVAAGVGVAAVAGAAAAMAAGTNKTTTGAADETVTPVVPGEPVVVTPVTTDTTATDAASAGTTGIGTTSTGTAAAAGSTGSVADLGDDRIGHAFDQTNGLVDTTGESDETLEGENLSAGERREDERRPDGGLPPVGGNLGQH
jgi:carbon monoxide dehydrogenase subunit G